MYRINHHLHYPSTALFQHRNHLHYHMSDQQITKNHVVRYQTNWRSCHRRDSRGVYWYSHLPRLFLPCGALLHGQTIHHTPLDLQETGREYRKESRCCGNIPFGRRARPDTYDWELPRITREHIRKGSSRGYIRSYSP